MAVIVAKDTMLLHLTSDKVLDLFSDCHVAPQTDEARKKVEALFRVVSGVMVHSTKIADPNGDELDRKWEGNPDLNGFYAPLDLLKKIACMMMHTEVDGQYSSAHKTTKAIIKLLAKDHKQHWDAIAVTALAAFALGYGNLCHLYDIVKSTEGDQLGKSLATLNNVVGQTGSTGYKTMVRNAYLAVDGIVALEAITSSQDRNGSPSIEKATKELPTFVYYAVLTLVICASAIDILFGSQKIINFPLSAISNKISDIHDTINHYFKKIETDKAARKEYSVRLMEAFQIPHGIVRVLNYLLFRNVSSPNVVLAKGDQGSVEVPLDKFKNKHVLLFISGLYVDIDYEIKVLEKIHRALKDNPTSGKDGIKKADFEIFWVPIVPDDMIERYEKINIKPDLDRDFNRVKAKVAEWSYVLDYSIIPSVCKKLIGDLAFPWRKDDDSDLNNIEWEWFWARLKNVNQIIGEWIKKEEYIIIYGGTDVDGYVDEWKKKWSRNPSDPGKTFKEALQNIKDHMKGKVVIEECYYEIDDTFWAFVQNFSHRMLKTEHSSLKNVQTFLRLRREKSGWAILSKGRHIQYFFRGDGFRQIVHEFYQWKEDFKPEAVEESFKKRYDAVIKTYDDYSPCNHLELSRNVGDVHHLHCAECFRPMEIILVRCVCCHGGKPPAEEGHSEAAQHVSTGNVTDDTVDDQIPIAG